MRGSSRKLAFDGYWRVVGYSEIIGDEDQLVQMNFRVTDELQQRIKIFAVKNRKTVREVLTEAFERLERSGL